MGRKTYRFSVEENVFPKKKRKHSTAKMRRRLLPKAARLIGVGEVHPAHGHVVLVGDHDSRLPSCCAGLAARDPDSQDLAVGVMLFGFAPTRSEFCVRCGKVIQKNRRVSMGRKRRCQGPLPPTFRDLAKGAVPGLPRVCCQKSAQS